MYHLRNIFLLGCFLLLRQSSLLPLSSITYFSGETGLGWRVGWRVADANLRCTSTNCKHVHTLNAKTPTPVSWACKVHSMVCAKYLALSFFVAALTKWWVRVWKWSRTVMCWTHSSFWRPWFTFKVSANTQAPESEMVLWLRLENVEEIQSGLKVNNSLWNIQIPFDTTLHKIFIWYPLVTYL